MSDYAGLDDLIGRMKRAAIDCWMADQGFTPNWGNDMIYSKWGWMLNFYNRPDANGVGGGDGNGVKHSVEAQFDQIRQAVDSVVSRWLDLPDGSNCEAPESRVSSAASRLGSDASAATVQATGDIATSNDIIKEALVNNIQGDFTAPFLDKYHTQSNKVARGLGDACVLLETNYAASAAMWPAARTDVMTLCEAARSAWEKQAADVEQANATFTLSVVATVAGVVASVVTAGTGTVAAVAALSTIGAAANTAMQRVSAEATVSGTSYGEILNSLSDGLGTLNTALYEQEQALQEMLNEANELMRADQPNFNLDAFALTDYTYGDGTINMEKSHARMVSNNMDRIEEALSGASTSLGSAPGTSPTPRNAEVGLGSDGTHSAASDLYALTARCLVLTNEEYVRGHGLFNATVDDYFETDANAEQTVAALLEDEALNSDLGV